MALSQKVAKLINLVPQEILTIKDAIRYFPDTQTYGEVKAFPILKI